MTDKQIIIDGIKTSKEDFIDNFAIELTNRNIFEREQIGGRYFDIILRKEQECNELILKNHRLLEIRDEAIKLGKQIRTLNIVQEAEIKELEEKLLRKEQECEKLKEELQKYKDNEQQEKEMQKLYNKFNGSSLIEKRSPNEF